MKAALITKINGFTIDNSLLEVNANRRIRPECLTRTCISFDNVHLIMFVSCNFYMYTDVS